MMKGEDGVGYIGDYIHARAENYRKYGIGRSEQRGADYFEALQQAHQDLYSYISGSSDFAQAKELEQYLDTSILANQNLIDDDFKQILEQHFNNHVIDFETKDIKALQTEFETKKVKYSQNNKERYSEQKINQFKTEIQLLCNKILNSGIMSQPELNVYLTQLRNLEKRLKNNALENDPQAKLVEYKNIFAQFNALSAELAAPSQKEKGDLAEVISYYLLAKASGKSEEVVQQLITEHLDNPKSSKNLVGGTGTNRAIALSGLVDNKQLAKAIGGNAWSVKTGSNGKYQYLTTVSARQDTVDIQLQWNNGEDIRASVKNYSSGGLTNKGIHFVSSTPLTLLFNLINSDFVNHYLNLLALKDQGLGEQKIEQSNEVIQKALLVRGLSGARGLGANYQANVLIINDSSTGKVKVVSIGQLLNRLIQSNNINNYINTSKLPTKITNDWVGDPNVRSMGLAGQRITKILAEIHSYKMDLSINPIGLSLLA